MKMATALFSPSVYHCSSVLGGRHDGRQMDEGPRHSDLNCNANVNLIGRATGSRVVQWWSD